MPTLRWDQVVEVTHDQAKQGILTFLDGQGFTATSWQKFSVPSLLVGIGAEIMARGSKVAVFLKGLGLNETSEGESLTRFSRSHYKNERDEGLEAQRRVELACSSAQGPYPIGVGDIVITHADGTTFRNVAGLSVVYPAALPSGGSLTMLFEAEKAGSAANFAAGELKSTAKGSLVTTLSGVTITSDEPDRDGVDVELDDRLKTRNSSKWAQQGQFENIRDRIENVALNASAAIKAVSVDDKNPRGAGTFDVYIAGLSGTAGSQDVLDLQAALDLRVLGQYADGPTPRGRAVAAPETVLDVAGTVYFGASYTPADVQAAVEGSGPAVKGALQVFVESVPLGGFNFAPGPTRVVRLNDLETAIKNAAIGGVTGAVRTVVLTTPAVDLSVASFGKVRLGSVALSYVATDGS